jgi:hypothetical protein
MRRLGTVLASLAVVFLLIPSIGLAIEPPVENGVGILCIYTTEDIETSDNVVPTVTPFVPFDIYFYIYNEQIDSDNLGGVEFNWRFEPVGMAPTVLQVEFPPAGLNVGGSNFNVVCGFGVGLTTVNNMARVMRANLFFTSQPENLEIFLSPPTPDSIDGEMAYNDFNNPGDIRVLKPNSVDGLHENPVFGFGMAIATEGETWGGVKSLFR